MRRRKDATILDDSFSPKNMGLYGIETRLETTSDLDQELSNCLAIHHVSQGLGCFVE